MVNLKKHTLLCLLNNSVELYGSRPAVSFVDQAAISYREFKSKIDDVTRFLKSEGIIAGDRVAILSENQPNWGAAYFAITTIGAIAVPIMTEFHSSEVHHIIRHSESKAIFISAKYFNKIDDLEYDSLQARILLEDFSVIPPNTKNDLLKEVITGGKKEFAKIKEAAMKFVGLISDEVEEDNLALILYTSGTTGHSKGVMLTHKNVVSDALSTLDMIVLGEHDRMLSLLPLFHTMESTLGLVVPIAVGASVTYLDKPPTAAALLPALQKVKPTVMLAVPLIIEKIYRNKILPEFNKKAIVRGLYKIPTIRKKLNKIAGKKLMQTFGGELKMFCIGGASLAADVEKFLTEAGFPYAIGYGLTETSPLVTGTVPENVRMRSAGKPMIWMQVKIDAPDPKTGEGEILIKGPNVMKGYFKDSEKTEAVFTEDGWLKSGDLGLIDSDGYLYIKGRSKNVIIGSNGKNIYPEEIEAVINEFPFVSESLVLDKGDQLIAKVYLNNEEIDKEFTIEKLSEPKAREIKTKILNDLLENVNLRVNTFSRINKVLEQPEPFEKTPTQKIKRYLYV
ncbi:MAG: AMP-dependent synthetase and ligase [Ignavibacteria bacterium]|nr:MAG: AMP-dependent synthetase and ligase [Ignavibacteria bacterium]KAF0160956.1 MAG: AMP-dependent synthetase and ligase [Ignavibacteria bacterium]